MFYELYGWWIGQLNDCIPTRWRLGTASAQDRMTITPVGPLSPDLEAVSVSAWAKSKETPLGRLQVAGHDLGNWPSASRLPVVLRLSDNDVLCKTISLPLAAEHDLAQVLAFEMDRETPFDVGEVYWSHRVVNRDRQRGQLSVRLRLVSRALLAPLLEALTDGGIPVQRMEIAGGVDEGLALPLGTDTAPPARWAAARTLRWASIATVVGLAVLVAAMPFIRQAQNIASLDGKIAAGRDAAALAAQLRRDIERLQGAGDVIKNERVAAGDPLAMLAALTTALPDDTYLTELQQQQHKVIFGGRSAAASRLIAAVSKSNDLHNPVFAAPVTRMEATHTEVFSIAVETGP
jgi:general secretion pathway protein L